MTASEEKTTKTISTVSEEKFKTNRALELKCFPRRTLEIRMSRASQEPKTELHSMYTKRQEGKRNLFFSQQR